MFPLSMGGQWKRKITWKQFWIFFSYFPKETGHGKCTLGFQERDSKSIQNCENKMKKNSWKYKNSTLKMRCWQNCFNCMKHKENNFKKNIWHNSAVWYCTPKEQNYTKSRCFWNLNLILSILSLAHNYRKLESQFECNLQTHSLPILVLA